MNPLDALLLILLIPFAFRGYFRGFCRETLGLVGLFGGVFAAAAVGPGRAPALGARHVLPAVAAWPIAWAAIFLAAFVLAALAGRIADGLARALLLGGVNRVAGALFGCAKGAAVLGFALLLSEQLVSSTSLTKAIAASRLGRPLAEIAGSVVHRGRQLGAAPGERQV